MLASKNLLKPADGEPIIAPSKDMVLGLVLRARATASTPRAKA